MTDTNGHIRLGLGVIALGLTLGAARAGMAEEVVFASANASANREAFAKIIKPWEAATGNKVKVIPMPLSTTDQFAQYKLWLSAGAGDVDVYQTDTIWARQLGGHFIDLNDAAKDIKKLHFPSIIASQTVDGRLVALPLWSDAPALYYRKDLLSKYGKTPPKTWEELAETAKFVQDAERAAGKTDIWGYVWQGATYEGLTCNAFEWVKSNGGGSIIEADGSISINNPKAIAAVDRAAGWIGKISPPGVLSYKDEDARGVWQNGNAVFMRAWMYVWASSNKSDSPLRGLFDVVPVPSSAGVAPAATLGGWNVAVSKYSSKQKAAADLAVYLASPEAQKIRVIEMSQLPTIEALYADPDVAASNSAIPRWKEVFLNAAIRPAAQTGMKYNEASSLFWGAVHKTLSGRGRAAENLEALAVDLEDLKGTAW